MPLDKEQQEAVMSYDRSVFLTAGAGAGKTKVLTERVKKILSNTDENVLAITFTNRAAEEMAARMAASLTEEETDRLVVKTIDGFCRYLLSIYAVEADTFGGMVQLAEGEARALLEKSYEKVAKGIFSDEDFISFLETSGTTANNFKSELLKSYDALRTRGALGDFRPRKVTGADPLKEYVDFLPALRGALKTKTSKLAKYLDEADLEALKNRSEEEQRAFLLAMPDGSSLKMDEGIKDRNEALKNRLLLREEEKNHPSIEAIDRALKLLDEAYREEKRTMGVVDFSDLLEMATALLESGKITCGYDHILVDEFQDTNPLQIRMLRALKGDGKLFVVGDRKQSIYGFRGADVAVGDDFRGEVLKEGTETMALLNNYRSHKDLVAAVGDLFADKIPDYEPITGHGEGEWALKGVDLTGEESAEEAIKKEALWIAEDIQKHPSESRALLLWRKKFMGIYESVFRDYGISYVNRSAEGFFRAWEVRDLMLAVEAKITGAFSPAFLRTPFIGANQEDVFHIVKGSPCRESVRERMARMEKFFDEMGPVSSAYEFLLALVEESGFRAYAFQEGGEQAAANVDQLLAMAKEYDEEGEHLEGFLHSLREMETAEEVGAATFGGDYAVEILTMHKAKGLEYDTVYLGHLFAKPRPEGGLWNYSEERGVGIKNPAAPAIYEMNRAASAEKAREENLRLLYVAMTRAKSHVYLLKSKEGEGLQSDLPGIDFAEEMPAPVAAPVQKVAAPQKSTSQAITMAQAKPVVSASRLLKGRAVFDGGKDSPKSAKDYLQLGILFHHYAQRARNPHGPLREKLLARAKAYGVADELDVAIKNYDATFDRGEILGTEVPFRAEFDGVILEGFYDQLRRMPEGIAIVDYKTGARGVRTGAMDTYRLQLGLYGTAYEKITGTFPKLYLFTTADGIWTRVELTEQEKEAIAALLHPAIG